MITKPITYNVNERGRKYRGVDRFLDTAALARLINSGPVQEMVASGDMVGYYGHWPRVKFGLEPVEAGIIDGKVVSIPAAVRTVELSADNDGNVTHRQEFLKTNEGRIAQRLFDSKQGGWSSAIRPVKGTAPIIPSGFFGFDYVLEPNYSTNRGHDVILDGVVMAESSEDGVLLDAAYGEMSHTAGVLTTMFDGLHAQHLQALETLNRLTRENEDLLSLLAARGQGGALLDSVGMIEPTMAMRTSALPDYERFRDAPLMALNDIKEPESKEASSLLRSALSHFGMRMR